jgi:predicted regulator of Ras-like GTPase activity (Roadblock/LC7/MglB family)
MLLIHAGEDAILALAAKPSKNLGMIFLDARKVAVKLLHTLERYQHLS